MSTRWYKLVPLSFALALAGACAKAPDDTAVDATTDSATEASAAAADAGAKDTADNHAGYYGTLTPFASEAVYFLMTDRFVDGDTTNNYASQGGDKATRTFNRPIVDLEGRQANIGYLGGDFAGVINNADYITEMGFTSVWITPIVENPDEAFTGGFNLGEAFFADRGKTGYHGYWGVNFFEEDEHLISPDLKFADFTRRMRDEHGLKVVLDIVCNHGSPAYTMPVDQPMYGELYDADGKLVADHQNLKPADLDPDNPLHRFFHREPDLAELTNNDENNPAVLDYYVAAYSKWIDQGAAAFRIDTIKHMPHHYWKRFADRIREDNPGLFMFAESFEFDPAKVAQHTWPENGQISVLDFPGQKAVTAVFEKTGTDFADLLDYLNLDSQLYQNPYELMNFYDNHDMPRMNADDAGFINAHNWIFTARGIPVVYYGSESGFRRGLPEHGGNRDYFGPQGIDAARKHPIRDALASIATVRRDSIALQRGLQANLHFAGDEAAFLRVYEKDGTHQSALVVLNKGMAATTVSVDRWLSAGDWHDAVSGATLTVTDAGTLAVPAPPNGVRVLLRNAETTDSALREELDRLQSKALRAAR